jgi:TonB family protein
MTNRLTFRSWLVWAVTVSTLLVYANAQDSKVLDISAYDHRHAPEVLEKLQQATAADTIDDPSLKPWHFKLNFQLFNNDGTATESGTIEEWWAGRSLHKTVYTSQSYTSTEIRTKNGFYRSRGASSVPILLELVERQVVNPLPNGKDVADSQPILRRINFDKTPVDCIILSGEIRTTEAGVPRDQQKKGATYASGPPPGLFPTYCFDRDEHSLRISYDFGNQLTTRNRIGTFQNRKVVVDQTTTIGFVNAITAHLAALETMPLTDEDFTPSTEFEKIDVNPVAVTSDVMANSLVSNTAPVYSETSKKGHVAGQVVLSAKISPEGRVRTLKLLSTPNAELGFAALAAVRQWIYRPYLRNGQPVEVDTKIIVSFNGH